MILDNAPSHPPLEELNIVNENVEVIYLPPNVTALIQPMDQGTISITKKFYKKNVLRSILFADTVEGVDNFLKDFNLRDCFPLLKSARNLLQNSTLNKVWKPILGDTFLINKNHSNAVQFDLKSTEDANEMLDQLSEISSRPTFGIEKDKEVC